jgi:hypothetical protein
LRRSSMYYTGIGAELDMVLIDFHRVDVVKKDQFANEAAFTMHKEE